MSGTPDQGHYRKKKNVAKVWTQEEIIKALKDGRFDLTDVIDAVIEINGMVGVGLITLGENLREYCYNKIRPL